VTLGANCETLRDHERQTELEKVDFSPFTGVSKKQADNKNQFSYCLLSCILPISNGVTREKAEGKGYLS
jgi:hypothetical protein